MRNTSKGGELTRREFTRLASAGAVAMATGCASEMLPGASDGGTRTDAGLGSDAGDRPDAGGRDAGERSDAGASTGCGRASFEELVAHPNRFESRAYDSDAEVDAGNVGPVIRERLRYDPEMNAARFVFPPNVGNAKQLHLEHADVASGTLFYSWEARWEAGWARGSIDGINRHKAFQISTHAGAGGGGLYLEPRVEYSVGRAPDLVGTVNVRTYDQEPPIVIDGGDRLGPQTGMCGIPPDTWIRHWAFVDFTAQQFSYWVCPGSGVVQIHDRVFHHLSRTIRSFWYEFNSSQTRTGGEELSIWGRRLAILRDLPRYDDAVTLITG